MDAIIVTCIVAWSVGNNHVVERITLPAMHTNEEIWLIDMTEYFSKHPNLKGNNNLVMPINSNECLFK